MASLGDSCALQSVAELKAATLLSATLGIPSHKDSRKHWDTLKALFHILLETDPVDAVLDAGASDSSAILYALAMFGYQNLHACNVTEQVRLARHHPIRFTRQDMSQTDYSDGQFRAVTSLSVIEHLDDLDAFWKEMFRILRRGGCLLLSTDYWSDLVDCAGIHPYGPDMPEMKVFTPEGIEDLMASAEQHGFSLIGNWDPSTDERPIHWERVDREYTFAFLALRRDA